MKQEIISLWQERIADKKASGLKLEEWCAQNQLTTHSYYYWRRKILDLNGDGGDAPLFVEIPTDTADDQKVAFGTVRIEWKELSIHVTDMQSVDLAAELLARLQKLC